MTFALPLTPPDRIEEAFQLLENEIIDMSVNPSVETFSRQHLNYIRDTYMSGSFGNQDRCFEWNFYNNLEGGQMTNNPSEGQNHRLASRAGKAHPGFYEFCSTIQKEVENTKTKIEQFETGKTLEVANRRAATLLSTRTALKNMLESQNIPLRKYLRSQGRATQIIKRRGKNHPEQGVRGALQSVTDADEDGTGVQSS